MIVLRMLDRTRHGPVVILALTCARLYPLNPAAGQQAVHSLYKGHVSALGAGRQLCVHLE